MTTLAQKLGSGTNTGQPMTLAQKLSGASTPAPTTPQPTMIGSLINSLGSSIGGQFNAGVSQAKQGYQQAQGAGLVGKFEAGGNELMGGVTAASSIFAPILSPVGKLINGLG